MTEFQVGGDEIEGRGIVFRGAEIVVMGEFHEVGVEFQAGHLAVAHFHVARAVPAVKRAFGMSDLAPDFECAFEFAGHFSASAGKRFQQVRHINVFEVRVGLEAWVFPRQFYREVAGGVSAVGLCFGFGEENLPGLQPDFAI